MRFSRSLENCVRAFELIGCARGLSAKQHCTGNMLIVPALGVGMFVAPTVLALLPVLPYIEGSSSAATSETVLGLDINRLANHQLPHTMNNECGLPLYKDIGAAQPACFLLASPFWNRQLIVVSRINRGDHVSKKFTFLPICYSSLYNKDFVSPFSSQWYPL